MGVQSITLCAGADRPARSSPMSIPANTNKNYALTHTERPRRRIIPREVIEAAYRRTDLFERRRRLMGDWAAYLAGESRDPEAGPIG